MHGEPFKPAISIFGPLTVLGSIQLTSLQGPVLYGICDRGDLEPLGTYTDKK